MRTSFLTVAVLALIVVSPSPAWADAATHTLTFVSISDVRERCDGGRCQSVCSIRASLANSRRRSPPLTVRLIFPSGSKPEPETELDLRFPAIPTGGSAQASARGGLPCGRTRVSKIEAFCPDSRDHCPGFFYLQVPDESRLRLRRQKVEAR